MPMNACLYTGRGQPGSSFQHMIKRIFRFPDRFYQFKEEYSEFAQIFLVEGRIVFKKKQVLKEHVFRYCILICKKIF